MTTAVQESRQRITSRDFKRRNMEPQRAAMRGMWGRSHTDEGILVGSLDPKGIPGGPDARSDDERRCERCERTGRIMQWMGTRWMRCCGAKA
ncbi:hypothetical protein LCGC14_2397450 [marine sediment metagenome]|uniref:Uncharacterized protein n=1 Tax=marine sediment metagenome TaxID=412755 RepID=A0A0F9BWH3_9ZZZZ